VRGEDLRASCAVRFTTVGAAVVEGRRRHEGQYSVAFGVLGCEATSGRRNATSGRPSSRYARGSRMLASHVATAR
jgi:hypothetical protein